MRQHTYRFIIVQLLDRMWFTWNQAKYKWPLKICQMRDDFFRTLSFCRNIVHFNQYIVYMYESWKVYRNLLQSNIVHIITTVAPERSAGPPLKILENMILLVASSLVIVAPCW